jgi:hypothetical protein
MIGFLIKKAFFDGWDNLFRIALLNIGFIAFAAIPVFLPEVLAGVPALSVVMRAVGTLCCCVYLAAASSSLRSLSDNQSFGFADFFANLKTAWPAGLVAGVLVFAGALAVTIILPFYLGIQSPVGLLFAALIFWFMAVALLALQFFFAIHFRLGDKIPKALKKCFIVFFDNPCFCLFVFLAAIAVGIAFLLLSFFAPRPAGIFLFLALLAPGPAGTLLFLDEAFRLRLLKYDWLEANPDANRKRIPWDALLIDEREKTGSRTLRNFIFPWKD